MSRSHHPRQSEEARKQQAAQKNAQRWNRTHGVGVAVRVTGGDDYTPTNSTVTASPAFVQSGRAVVKVASRRIPVSLYYIRDDR